MRFINTPSLIRSIFHRKTPFSSETAILSGVYAVGIVFLILFFFDLYLFYTSVIQKAEKTIPFSAAPLLSEKGIAGVIDLLDKREQEFKKILAQ